VELAVARVVGRVVAGQVVEKVVEKAAGLMCHILGSRGSGGRIQTQNRRQGI